MGRDKSSPNSALSEFENHSTRRFLVGARVGALNLSFQGGIQYFKHEIANFFSFCFILFCFSGVRIKFEFSGFQIEYRKWKGEKQGGMWGMPFCSVSPVPHY